jgi:hypothetical protein
LVAQEAVTGGHAESISAWVNDAPRLKADHDRRLQALDDFLAAYEAEHGEITDDGLERRRDQPARRAAGQFLDIFSGNLLAQAGALRVFGTPLQLQKITIPTFVSEEQVMNYVAERLLSLPRSY